MPRDGGEWVRVIGQPPLLRKINQRAVLELLRKQGPMSRAELTRALRLSKSTVSQVVMSLLERGLVREEGRHPASPGAGGPRRRSVRLEVVPEAGFVVGIDLGGTLLRAAVADLGGEIRARHTEPTEHRGLPELLAQLEGAVRQVMSAAHVPVDRLLSVAVGVPGAVSAVNRCVQLCPNLPALQGVDLGRLLGDRLRVDVLVENDVNLAAVGEKWKGCARGVDSFAYLAIGTGLGMGIVLENRLYRGTRGIAGEIAYLPYLTSSGPKPLESVIAGGSIRRRFGVEARDLFQAARAGDAKAIEVVHEIGTAIGWAVAAVTVLLDVGLIVLGGGIGQNTDLLLPRISAQAAALVPVRPEIRASALAGEASMYGAIAVALRTGRDSVEEMGSYVALTGCD